MTNLRYFSPTGFAIASLLCLALISNTSSAAARSASSAVTEDELAKIEKMLDQAKEQFKHQNYEGLALSILNSLEQLTASTKTDKVLFLILRLKIAIGTLIDAKGYLKADERAAGVKSGVRLRN